MGETRKVHTREFREDGVRLLEIGARAGAQIAEDLGIGNGAINPWRRQLQEEQAAGIRAFPGYGNPRDEKLGRHQGIHSVEKMARTLGVSRSGYYAWRSGPRSERERRDEALTHNDWFVQEKTHYRYGSPRMTEHLARRGHRVGHNHVPRLMSEDSLQARRRRRFRSTTESDHQYPVAPNTLDRRSHITEPDVAWARDLASRKIVGWSREKRMKADLVADALAMAINQRRPPSVYAFRTIETESGEVAFLPNRGNSLMSTSSSWGTAHFAMSGNKPTKSSFPRLTQQGLMRSLQSIRVRLTSTLDN